MQRQWRRHLLGSGRRLVVLLTAVLAGPDPTATLLGRTLPQVEDPDPTMTHTCQTIRSDPMHTCTALLHLITALTGHVLLMDNNACPAPAEPPTHGTATSHGGRTVKGSTRSPHRPCAP